jgi:hypothetical protein
MERRELWKEGSIKGENGDMEGRGKWREGINPSKEKGKKVMERRELWEEASMQRKKEDMEGRD